MTGSACRSTPRGWRRAASSGHLRPMAWLESRPPVDVGKPDIHDHEIDLTGLGGLYALGSIVDHDRLEFLKQCELLDQRLAQLGVVVHDQDFAGIRHSSALRTGISPGTALREIEHSGVKEQADLLR